MALRDQIVDKALLCIDETNSSDGANASFFPVEQLLDEAARWVIRVVPLQALGTGKELPAQSLVAREDGTGSLSLPDDFVRLLRFRMKGWHRPVVAPIRDTDASYVRQFNPVLRGGESKPVVALCENGKKLEYFSSSMGRNAEVEEARYFGFTTVDDDYPQKLVDLTAWKTAEAVLTVMNDTTGMQLCAAKVTEILQLL